MSKFFFWLKLAWRFKTPFVILRDSAYDPGTYKQLEAILSEGKRRIAGRVWKKNKFDRDKFQEILKGVSAESETNFVGTLWGLKGWERHQWGFARMDDDTVIEIEPQRMAAAGKGYHSWLVIL